METLGSPQVGARRDHVEDWETASNVSGISTQSSTVYESSDIVGKFFSRIRHNRSKEAEQMLDSGFVSIEQRGENGITPLMTACQNGHKRVAKALLKRFADINAQEDGGRTALHYCYRFNHRELAEYLVSKGADDSIRDHQGATCYAEVAAAANAAKLAQETELGKPSIGGYSMAQVAAAAASVAGKTGAGATKPWEDVNGMQPMPAWAPNTASEGGEPDVPLHINTESLPHGFGEEESPQAAISLSPGSSPESWSSLKANVSLGGSQRESSFMQNLDEMVMLEKARQRGAQAKSIGMHAVGSSSSGNGYAAQLDAQMYSTPTRAANLPSMGIGAGPASMSYAPGPVQQPYNSGGMPPSYNSAGPMGAPMYASIDMGLVNETSPRHRPPKASQKLQGSRKGKMKPAPLPMCAEDDRECEISGTAMMSVVVDHQATPPASLDRMPDFPEAHQEPTPLSSNSGYLDLEAVGAALKDETMLPPAISPQEAVWK